MRDVFDNVVCGIDGSAQAFEALRQVERLRPNTGELHLTTATELSLAVHGGFAAPSIYDRMITGAESALTRAGEHSAATSSRLVEGEPADVLRREAERRQATAIASAATATAGRRASCSGARPLPCSTKPDARCCSRGDRPRSTSFRRRSQSASTAR
jgi:hypothetical protein